MNRYLILADKALAHEVEPVEAVEPITTAGSKPLDLQAAWRAMVEELDADPTFPPEAVEALRVAHVTWAAAGP